VIEEIFDRSEKRMREHINSLPKGTFEFEDWLDDTGPGSPPVRVHCAVTIEGGDLTIDFSGSSDQVAAGINSYINYTRAYSGFAVKVLADALLPQNHGAARPITVKSREGSFFNPRYPAPSGGRAGVQVRIFEAVNGALSAAMPERVMGAHSHWANPNISGVDDRTGKQFVQYDLVFGGLGALSYKDGAEAMSPVMNCSNIPIEVLETNNPLLFHRLELVPDSAGAGKFRGGCAIRKDVEIRNSKALITLLGDRHVNPPYGLFGGKPGTLAETILVRDGEKTALGSKQSLQLKRGDIISYRLSGAGGYEDPAKRDPARIESDLLDGYVTEAGAERDYGFRIDGDKAGRRK
jgi:N-methylhydantoinase B